MTNFAALGQFGQKMYKIGLKMGKIGLKMGEISLKIVQNWTKNKANMRQKVTFLDTVRP